MDRYGMGDLVYAAVDLFNEPMEETGASGIPGVAAGALLAAAGTRGDPIGCLPEELTGETAPA